MNNFFGNVLDSLFGEKFLCACCDDENVFGGSLCEKCKKSFHTIQQGCEKCGDEVGAFGGFCENCKDPHVVHKFDRVFSYATYDGTAKELVHLYKYGGKKHIGRVVADFVICAFDSNHLETLGIDAVIAVPLNKKREKERGFNQSLFVAQILCKKRNLLLFEDAVKRIKNTPSQTNFTREQRRENVKNVFEVSNKEIFKNKTVLVVDDICTTGATIDELARVLKKCKAKHVFGLTFCHTTTKKD